MNLVIDIGNTKVKAAVFESDTIKVAYVFDEVNFFEELEYILEKHINKNYVANTLTMTRNFSLKKITHFIKYMKETCVCSSMITVMKLLGRLKLPTKKIKFVQ